ncbi:hypothetical protein LEM8419_00477 [Neolewinella maritima]|uniref:Uncharacterized protein n=1 Tax=Neolewinella maritima TaxID=1383882 RepID=A0ABM9AWR8_9BACT|nr:DUF6624 domain-containing protein [Neolewinella maritima]CAH0999180.1 hypothetical protein LEM8419_00477 [Neolewinella maritima]
MNKNSIAKKLLALKQADLDLRNQLLQGGQLSEGYNKEMEALHRSNAQQLAQLIDTIGYPTVERVGEEASAAAWLLIQHAISLPDFMRRCRTLLEEAVRAGQADPVHLAYLSDRIAVFEGKVQRYGTQFDWDAEGRLSPQLLDDRAMVDARRKAIGLNTLEEQTELLRQRADGEKQVPPGDARDRKRAYDIWRKAVGWID